MGGKFWGCPGLHP